MVKANFSRLDKIVKRMMEGAVRSAMSGEIDNRCMTYRKMDDGEPKEKAWCPACRVGTHWRGPHPSIEWDDGKPFTRDPPIVKKNGVVSVAMPGYSETREAAARRLYRIADKWDKGPESMYSVRVDVWQGALCDPCERGHMDTWLEAVSPEQKRQNQEVKVNKAI